jgi:hypothetical protein
MVCMPGSFGTVAGELISVPPCPTSTCLFAAGSRVMRNPFATVLPKMSVAVALFAGR